MFVKLVVLACISSVALAAYNGPLAGGEPAHRYPAGVDPSACPNFPHCNNPAVAVNQQPAHAWNAQPQWNAAPQNQWNPAPQNHWNAAPQNQWNAAPQQWNAQPSWNGNQNALDSGAYTGDGDWHGEGLAEAGAFGDISHNFNDPAPGHPIPQAAHHVPVPGLPAQLPAGVDAHACPNYPYCH
ncbi:uncharacterized protein LOC108742522 [Agrilus planipennis]|uniref:Uncharacterized protein LOC108742522 n=1 Tax=Agrilus planipennis TaxID=224129 RepID=A0A1W4XKG5_AGRPL|nr:uncharacterized protein LOC108742522 [Agrilus planipennis]